MVLSMTRDEGQEPVSGRPVRRSRRLHLGAVVAAAAILAVAGSPGQTTTPPAGEPPPSAEAAQAPGPESAPPAGEKPGAGGVRVGEPFPPLALQELRPGADRPGPLDLGPDLGKRPILFVYFVPTHQVSEEILLDAQRFLAAELKDKVAFHPVVRLGKRFEITELIERMRLLGVTEPVVLDEDGRVQKAIGVGVVPAMALIDGKGRLAFTRATSLRNPVDAGVDVREAIRIASRGGDPPLVPRLPRYLPAADMVGERFRDFALPDYRTGDLLKLSDHVKPGRLTALFYWGVTCALSKAGMPEIVAAHRTFGGRYLDVISVVRDRDKAKVEAFAAENGMTFPILQDRDGRFTSQYRVISTPTLIVIGPDGTVVDVDTGDTRNYYLLLQAKVLAFAPKPAPPPPGR